MNRRLLAPALLVVAAALALPTSASATYQLGLQWGGGSGDGPFNSPVDVAAPNFQSSGHVAVADLQNDQLQLFVPNGLFYGKWGSEGTGDGQFLGPDGVASGVFSTFVADAGNDRIQRFDDDAGFSMKWGTSGTGNGQFAEPGGVAVQKTISPNVVYVADTGNDRIQRFSTFNGSFISKWGSSGSGQGELDSPSDVAIGLGGVYVADTGNNRIQQFDTGGTFIRTWGTTGSGDGQFNSPQGVATDMNGNVYVADTGNDRIQKFSLTGQFITKWGATGSGDGQFDSPQGVDADIDGNVLVADTGNNRIQSFFPVGPDTSIDQAPSGLINDATPTFEFSATPAADSFECRVRGSGQAFAPCTSPHTTGELEDGLNVFVVRGVDSEGADPTPAEAEFRLDTTPPETRIDSGPRKKTRKRHVTFTFSSSEAAGTPPFRCSLDGASFTDCDSPFTTSGLSAGKHVFRVQARDVVGNEDPTPARKGFSVVR
jgi:hypothetical protein